MVVELGNRHETADELNARLEPAGGAACQIVSLADPAVSLMNATLVDNWTGLAHLLFCDMGSQVSS